MSDYRDKEVYFNEYCKKCIYEDKEESEFPCSDCLEEPSNEYSHKPVKFVLKEKNDDK